MRGYDKLNVWVLEGSDLEGKIAGLQFGKATLKPTDDNSGRPGDVAYLLEGSSIQHPLRFRVAGNTYLKDVNASIPSDLGYSQFVGFAGVYHSDPNGFVQPERAQEIGRQLSELGMNVIITEGHARKVSYADQLASKIVYMTPSR